MILQPNLEFDFIIGRNMYRMLENSGSYRRRGACVPDCCVCGAVILFSVKCIIGEFEVPRLLECGRRHTNGAKTCQERQFLLLRQKLVLLQREKIAGYRTSGGGGDVCYLWT